jgi:hypothetical protein
MVMAMAKQLAPKLLDSSNLGTQNLHIAPTAESESMAISTGNEGDNVRTPFGREMREKHFLFAKGYLHLNQGNMRVFAQGYCLSVMWVADLERLLWRLPPIGPESASILSGCRRS